jgi:hypothetical protein
MDKGIRRPERRDVWRIVSANKCIENDCIFVCIRESHLSRCVGCNFKKLTFGEVK